MPTSLFWLIISIYLSTPNPIPTIEYLVATFNPAYEQQLKTTEDPEDIHASSIIIDSHIDTMMHVIDEQTWLPKTNIGEKTSLHVDIPKLQTGGPDAAFFAAFTSGYYGNTPRSISETLALIHALYWTEAHNKDQLNITTNTMDILSTIRAGKIAAIPSIEGAYSLDENNAMELLHQYHDLGIKAIGFNWNYSNALGEGANRVYGDAVKTPSEGGLTELGSEVVKEMNKLGMLIDVSHMSENTFWDVLEVTEAPVMATHSGVNALKNHQRNLTDDQLLALAENGGVIGIVFYPAFISNDSQASVEDIADHIDYVVNLIGIDHVAIGSDLDGSDMPADIEDATDLNKVTDELINRGYSNQDIEKILGKNTLRLLMEVEKKAENSPYPITNQIEIHPAYEMGEIVEHTALRLEAKLQLDDTSNSELDTDSLRVIVDGISYEPNYDTKTSTISLQLKEPLQEKFHVVTFEASTTSGETERQTRIFYTK